MICIALKYTYYQRGKIRSVQLAQKTRTLVVGGAQTIQTIKAVAGYYACAGIGGKHRQCVTDYH